MMASLAGCVVERIAYAEAKALILKYEWLGTMPASNCASYGLRTPEGDLIGAVCFGRGPGRASADLCGPEWRDKAIALLRGACVHYAPKNAASFLISRACKLAAHEFGWRAFSAYADAAAGEVGTIYQALNWIYLGVSVGRTANGLDRWRYYCRKSRRWHSEWMLRQRGIRGPPLRCDPGWKAERLRDKMRYVHFEGDRRERNALKAALKYEPMPYPKRPGVEGRRKAWARSPAQAAGTAGPSAPRASRVKARRAASLGLHADADAPIVRLKRG
jgi:hypothetical protein